MFANIGYFQKAPDFDTVFLNFSNDFINPDAKNQEIFSMELGYGYRSEKFSANVNIYRTAWDNRSETYTYQEADGRNATANILGVNALHQGLELDFVYRATDKLKLTGMASFGDWTWANDVKNVQIYNEDQDLITTIDLYIEDLHVGDAAQTTLALGVNYELLEKTIVSLDYNYYDNLYADFDPSNRTTPNSPDAWQVPAYSLFDLGLSHNFPMGPFDVMLLGRMNNIFNVDYVADAQDGTGSGADTALVFYGAGRTFSIGAKLNF